MEKERTNPTLEDLAAQSGLSIATVSRAINASGPVSDDAEQRVKHAIDALGFKPKRKRRRPLHKPPLIACIVPKSMNPAITMITAGVQEEAERMNIHVFIVPVSEEPGSLHRNLNLLKQVPADGIILAHLEVQPEDIMTLCRSQELPMVALKRNFSPFSLPCIDSDRENGMYQATKLLIGLNHRDIAYFSGIRDSDQAEAKLHGVQRALTEANLSLKPEFSRKCLSTTDDGFRVATNLLQLPPRHRPTAILAYNDLVAIGALHAIRSAGLSVPDDMSVVGFDNIPQASHSNPPLTTVAQPQYQKGQLGVQQLMNWLNGEHVDHEGFTLLSCSLVVRESTGPCPPNT